MSTFGTALVVDVAPGGELRGIAATLNALRPSPAVAHEMESGWTRVVAATFDIETLAQVKVMLMSGGTGPSRRRRGLRRVRRPLGRAVRPRRQGPNRSSPLRAQRQPAETAAGPRRDPQPRRSRPRDEDVAGEPAAVSAAELFDVPPGPMVEAERSSGDAYKGIGTVGGPFPWWKALWLPWPEEAIGRPLGPDA